MKCALVVCILVLALGSHASKHGKSSSSSSEDKDSCVPAQCIGEGELGSSCGPVSDGCGHTLQCGACKSGEGFENLRCRAGKCVCLVTGCPAGGPCTRSDGCGGTQTCCEPPGLSNDVVGCCEVGGEFTCTQLIGGSCPEIHSNQDTDEDKDLVPIKLLEVDSKQESTHQYIPTPNSKWIVGTIGGLLIVAGLVFMVKKRRNYHIESAHLLSSKHQPLY